MEWNTLAHQREVDKPMSMGENEGESEEGELLEQRRRDS